MKLLKALFNLFIFLNYNKIDNSNDVEKPAAITIDQDVEILIKLALTDLDTKEWIKNSLDYKNELKILKEYQLLVELFDSLPCSENPEEINAFISSKDSNIATILNEIIMRDFAQLSVADAKKSLIRLKIRNLQEEIDFNKTKSKKSDISHDEILTLTSKVASQRKELLDFKKALSNIDETRE